MRNEITYWESIRARIRNELPENAFLKSDRGEGLFITNAPDAVSRLSGVHGFRTEKRGNLTVIYPSAECIRDFEDNRNEPAGDLSRSVYSFRNGNYTDTAILLFTEGLNLIRYGTPPAIAAYDKRVRQHIAEALRKSTVGGCYAIAVLDDLLNASHKE